MVFPKNKFPIPFYETAPHLFSGPKGLYDAFRGEIVMNENFARFFLKRPRNFFSEKHVSCFFYETAPLTYFRGQTDYVTLFEAKFPETKTSLGFA